MTSALDSMSRLAFRSRPSTLRWVVAGAVVVVWGVNFVVAKHALDQFNIGTFNAIRFAGMTALGWIVLALSGGAARPAVQPEHRRQLVMAGLVGFAGYVYGFSVGVTYTTAFSASLLLALVPLWVVAITAVRQRSIPSAATLVGLALALIGVTVFVSARTSIEVGWGDLVAVAVAGAYAAYLTLNAPLARVYPPVALTTYALTIAAVPVVLVNAPGLYLQEWGDVTPLGWLSMIWAITLPVFALWSVWNWVLQDLTGGQVAPLLFAVPVVSGLAAWLLLGESITRGQILGTALVLVALRTCQRASR